MYLNKRSKTRKYIIQILYTWKVSKNNIIDIKKEYLNIINTKTIDMKYFNELIKEISIKYHEIDKKIECCLNRKSQEIGLIEQAILRLSFYELYNRIDIPYKVSINESIELAKLFGSSNSYKFINGVLQQAINNINNIK